MATFVTSGQIKLILERIKAWLNVNTFKDVQISGIKLQKKAQGASTWTDAGTIQDASSSKKGVVQLVNTTSGTSTTLVPTQNAVKSALDGKANLGGAAGQSFSASDLNVGNGSTPGSIALDSGTVVRSGKITLYPALLGDSGDFNLTLPAVNDTIATLSDVNAVAVTVDTALSSTSTNPVQNKVINTALNDKAPKNGSASNDFSIKQLSLANRVIKFGSGVFDYTLPEKSGTVALTSDLAISNRYTIVPSLPTANANTMEYIYLVPSANSETQNAKDEYITIDNGASATPRYTWEQIGTTTPDLDDYWAKTELEAATTGAENDAASTAENASIYALLNQYFPISA